MVGMADHTALRPGTVRRARGDSTRTSAVGPVNALRYPLAVLWGDFSTDFDLLMPISPGSRRAADGAAVLCTRSQRWMTCAG